MRLKQVKRYRRARYPRGSYRRPMKGPVHRAARGGISSLLLMALTEACGDTGIGTTGPPPVMPDMLTEAEARAIIDRIFIENEIALEKDFPLIFRWAEDSLAFEVDGFNDSLKVGYEYVERYSEDQVFTQEFRTALDSAGNADGPYIDLIRLEFFDHDQQATVEAEIEAFIQKLKGMGII